MRAVADAADPAFELYMAVTYWLTTRRPRFAIASIVLARAAARRAFHMKRYSPTVSQETTPDLHARVLEAVRRHAVLISTAIIALPVVLYVLVLNRLPPYMDEPFFGYSALLLLTNGSMACAASALRRARRGTLVWAYHGPILPLLQAALFKVIGVSWFSVRPGQPAVAGNLRRRAAVRGAGPMAMARHGDHPGARVGR